jgi:ATP/maltotriose-dependent transcriptional regulator MalT
MEHQPGLGGAPGERELLDRLAAAETGPGPQPEGPARAELLSLLSRYKLDSGDVEGAVAVGEQALAGLSDADPLELRAQCYVNLGEALLAAHKARRAARLMIRYLRTRGTAPEGILDGRACLLAGEALLQLGHAGWAEQLLQRAEPRLRSGGRPEHLDRCYRARLQVRYAQGALTEVHRLLTDWEDEMMARPRKDPGRVRFTYAKAELQARLGNHSRAIRLALQCLEQADERDEMHFDAYMLLCRTAAQVGEAREALAFALTARSWAVDHARRDLELTATAAMIELIRAHGEVLVSGLQDLYRVHGIDISQFIPSTVRRSDEQWL